MSLFPLTADQALASIGEWRDPNPTPVLEEHAGIVVVRDDLLPAGSKARFIDYLIQSRPDVDEWVYGNSPRVGFGQISLAYVANRYGKKSTVFLAKAKELHRNSRRARDYGANIVEVPMGFMNVTAKRAADYVQEPCPHTRALVPFGLADETVYGSIVRVARSLPYVPDEVWSVAGSGVLSRGLQLAWPEAKVYAVSVGHVLSEEERGRAVVIRHPQPFATPVKVAQLPPFPSVGEYDAKAWQHILAKANRRAKVLFWNVAG